MYGRRYELLIGKAYANQIVSASLAEEISAIPGGTVEDVSQLDRVTLDASVINKRIYRAKTREEIQQEQQAIIDDFVGSKGTYASVSGSYKNLVYDDPRRFDEFTGWLDENNILVSDHHITFEIEKVGSNSSEGNQGTITIFNLSDDMAELIGIVAETQNFLQLSAGYEDEEVRVIMRGNIKSVEDKFDGVDRRTKIVVNDGAVFLQNQMSVRVFPKGTPIVDLVDALVEDLALPRGNIVQIGGYGTLSKPLIIHGRSIDQLKRVLDNFGFVVNIQDLFINIYNKRIDETLAEFNLDGSQQVEGSFSGIARQGYRQKSIPYLSYETGLLAAPSFITDVSDQTQQEIANESARGIKFNHLLNGEFIPNGYIYLDTDRFIGIYRILSVTHRGSLEGGEWFSEVEAERLVVEPKEDQENSVEDPAAEDSADRVVPDYGFPGRSVNAPAPTENEGAFGGFQR